MATWTKAQWAAAALVRLGITAVGQTPPAAQQALAEKGADSLFARLRLRRLAPFAVATIPEGAQTPLKCLLAAELLTEFHVSGERRAAIMAEAREAKKELAVFSGADQLDVPVEVDWY